MATKMMWIVTGWFAHYEELNYTSPSEEFFADSYEEAIRLQIKMSDDPIYESVTISEEPEERNFY